MRSFTLSNHTATLAEQAQQAREMLDAEAEVRYVAASTSRHQRIRESKTHALSSLGNLHLAAALVAACRWTWLSSTAKPSKPLRTPVSRQEMVWKSGRHGEDLACQHFGGMLGDDWTAVSGYTNVKGEIDLVLIGPQGIICLEIKYLNALVHCAGDEWTRDNFDRYGNLVESALPINDKAGRSPARQLLEPCAALSRFIENWGLPFEVPLWTAVLLTHANSRVGRLRRPTVDFVGRLEDFRVESLMPEVGHRAPFVNVPVVVELLHMHHRQCSERQARRRALASRGRE